MMLYVSCLFFSTLVLATSAVEAGSCANKSANESCDVQHENTSSCVHFGKTNILATQA